MQQDIPPFVFFGAVILMSLLLLGGFVLALGVGRRMKSGGNKGSRKSGTGIPSVLPSEMESPRLLQQLQYCIVSLQGRIETLTPDDPELLLLFGCLSESSRRFPDGSSQLQEWQGNISRSISDPMAATLVFTHIYGWASERQRQLPQD